MPLKKETNELKEFIQEKFANHEELEKLRFKRIDELLAHFQVEVEGNETTIKRVHARVDRIENSIKTVKGISVAISGAVATVAAWVGMTK
tara:strand:- start:1447 stop:1716 length:270 start_codon:yes stop_codon:yes gene_type:complete